ncbi:MAG TPA: LysR substrate-binding domain-containing protein [Dissulfurispiraceae bacterium]|nr:LysR substrate-binding domain-containing protein [Dissulfurispiraceae bacterium]
MRKKVTFGVSGVPFAFLIPELFPRLVSKLPDVELVVDVGERDSICEKVANGRLEVGVIAMRQCDADVDFDIVTINDRLVAIAPTDHPLTTKEDLVFSDLKGQDFVGFSEGMATREWYEGVLRDAGMSLEDLNIVIELGDHRGVIRLVENGTGISILSELAARNAIRTGRVAQLNFINLTAALVQRTYYLVTSKKHPMTPEAKRVFITTRDVLRTM